MIGAADRVHVPAMLAGFDPIDVQLARLFIRRSDERGMTAAAVAVATLLVSRALREGHSALSLESLARQADDIRAAHPSEPLADLSLADAQSWGEALRASALVSDGSRSESAPLALHDGVLQFSRYAAAERRIAERISILLQSSSLGGVRGFAIVTGGPGTGKTTYVAAHLTDVLRNHPDLRVALAAPTGKAAARLTESMRLRLLANADSAADSSLHATLATLEARTLHRLLGYNARDGRFRRNAGSPLEYDLVIVDEASMVDVLMLDALLGALKPGARLMLVGDHNQLSSVDAGDVLGVLCRSASAEDATPLLRECVTWRTDSFRFAATSGIGALAGAILRGGGVAVERSVTAPLDACVQVLTADVHRAETAITPVIAHLQRYLTVTTPVGALDALDAFRLLAPGREGHTGVRSLNGAVERWLLQHGRSVRDTWYHGRPVLVTANDYASGLFNGDVGVVWHDADGVAVHFRGQDGGLRAVTPSRLPAVDTAWAMTVHKSQGSEFDDVVVVLSAEPSRLLSRELLYTAVTRARKRVTLVTNLDALHAAVHRPSQRTSGLQAYLNR